MIFCRVCTLIMVDWQTKRRFKAMASSYRNSYLASYINVIFTIYLRARYLYLYLHLRYNTYSLRSILMTAMNAS